MPHLQTVGPSYPVDYHIDASSKMRSISPRDADALRDLIGTFKRVFSPIELPAFRMPKEEGSKEHIKYHNLCPVLMDICEPTGPKAHTQ